MTDTASTPLDPHRPWIEDPRDLPSEMNWVQSLTNPFGETSRLHFTRAWTALFFTRVIYFFGVGALSAVFALARAPALSIPAWIWPLLVVVTAILSLILHVRRLADARRSPLWAVLVIVPVLLGFVGFVMGAAGGAQQYQAAVEARNAPREAPAAPAETSGEGEAAEGEAAPAERPQPEGRRGPQLDVTQISARDHALQAGLGFAQILWMISAFFVMLWSLLWVGRLPTGGGTIKERVAGVDSVTYGAS